MHRPKGLTDREWIETLEERVRQLETHLAPPLNLPLSWRLPAAIERVFRTILARSPGLVSHDALLAVMEPPGADCAPSPDTLKVYVSRIRAALRTIAPGATIRCAVRNGYYVDAESAALIRAAIERAGAPAPLRLAA